MSTEKSLYHLLNFSQYRVTTRCRPRDECQLSASIATVWCGFEIWYELHELLWGASREAAEINKPAIDGLQFHNFESFSRQIRENYSGASLTRKWNTKCKSCLLFAQTNLPNVFVCSSNSERGWSEKQAFLSYTWWYEKLSNWHYLIDSLYSPQSDLFSAFS